VPAQSSTAEQARTYASTPPVEIPFATVAEMFQFTAARCGDRVALRTLHDEDHLTWNDYAGQVRVLAAGLAALGVQAGSTVAMMMGNRSAFHLVDTAALHLGAVPWSVYNTYPQEAIAHLLRDSCTQVAVTEQAMLPVLRAAAHDAGVEHVVVVDGAAPEGALALEDLRAMGDPAFDFDAAWRAIDPGDLSTIIYTSGTTGPPKGVQITHANAVASVVAYAHVWDLPDAPQLLSWLPMAHIAERLLTHYAPMLTGGTVTICPDGSQVYEYLTAVRPHYFFGVPRMWEKLKARAEAELAGADEATQRRAQRGLEAGRRRLRDGEPILDEDEQALADWRRVLGLDRITMSSVGAAPCPFDVIEFFNALGVPLGEVYGQSEGTGAATLNPPRAIKVGTVGPPLPGVEIRIAEDGEVLVRSAAVMPGYRNNPVATAEALNADGWLHSGDIGALDEDGYLRIVDRKKEIIINSSGKNMSPAHIESTLKSATSLIDQVITIGDRRPYNVALLTLQTEAVAEIARRHGLAETSVAALAGEQLVVDAVVRGIEQANERLARAEQIKRFKILPAEWQPGGDELTPTQKLKRKPIIEKYAAEIDALYA
jgi:long-subunit acyl-CoA synthetase (AMP-forming)